LGKIKNSVKSAASSVASKVTSAVKKTVSSTASKVSSTYKAVTKKATAVVSKATSTVKKAVSSTASKVSSAYKAVTKKATAVVSKATSTVKKAVSSTASKVSSAYKAVTKKATAVVSKAASAVKKASSNFAKVTVPVKNAISNAAKKITTTFNAVKKKVTTAINNTAKNVKNIASNISKTVKTVAANAGKKFTAAVKQAKTTISNIKSNVSKAIKSTKTFVSKAQEKIKTTIKGYATLMKQRVKTGVSNVVSKVKQTASNVWNKTKQTVSNISKNPVVQRVAKGIGATLQIAGGIVQTAGGIALSGTGLGAVIGVPVTAHGAADIVQGGLKLFNAITGKSVPEVNFMQEAYKYVGKKLGGEKGVAIANSIFNVADIGLGLISPTKLAGSLSKINNLGDAVKYLKAAPKNIIKSIGQMGKNAVEAVPKFFKTVKSTAVKVADNISTIGRKLKTVATKTYTAVKGIPAKAANTLSGIKRFTASFKTTLGNVGQALGAGVKEYNIAACKQGIMPNNPLAEGIQAGVKKFKELGNGVSEAKSGINQLEPYAGVKQASEYLKSQGVPRNVRKKVLESFDTRTIYMDKAGESTFGIRFHDFGVKAQPKGRYLYETFQPLSTREGAAIKWEWNDMIGVSQWQVKSGTTIIKGKAAPQIENGVRYGGGIEQWWINNLDNLVGR